MAEETGLPFTLTVNDLLEAGLHFGHQSKRWNPKMKRFIFDKRAGIYIIDLEKTLAQLREAQRFVYDIVVQGKSLLFVGTKKQAQDILKDAATRCGQHYIISRWLGGMLTNHQNIASSVRRMRHIQELDQSGTLASMPQKEASRLRHELARLDRNLSGIATLDGMPGALMIVDVNREAIAVREANRMGIPVIAVVDTNTDPDPIQYPIPGNDDSTRGIRLIVNVLVDAVNKAAAEFAVVRAREQAAAAAAAASDAAKPAAAEPAAAAAQAAKPRPERDRRPRAGGRTRATGHASDRPADSKPAAPTPPPSAPGATGTPA